MERFDKEKKVAKYVTAPASEATLKGDGKTSAKAQKAEDSDTQKKQVPCLCSRKHHWAECHYLNKDYPRAPNWNPDQATKAEVKKKLKHPKLREGIEQVSNYEVEEQTTG